MGAGVDQDREACAVDREGLPHAAEAEWNTSTFVPCFPSAVRPFLPSPPRVETADRRSSGELIGQHSSSLTLPWQRVA